jgi:hypothetical protein
MDVGLLSSSPSGVNFMPVSPAPSPNGVLAWPEDLNNSFMDYISKKKSCCLLTSRKRSDYRYYRTSITVKPRVNRTIQHSVDAKSMINIGLCLFLSFRIIKSIDDVSGRKTEPGMKLDMLLALTMLLSLFVRYIRTYIMLVSIIYVILYI